MALTAKLDIPRSLFESVTATAGSSINIPTQIQISGGGYASFDTRDGFYTVKDVPIFSEVPKGVKDAPEDIGRVHMQKMVDYAQGLYKNGRFAAPVHKGHNKMLAVQDPEFLGFFLPTRVGRLGLDGRDQDVIFADIKLKASAFERVMRGELPYFSPEVDWETMSFSSLSSLDSQPPHFKFPIFTVLPPTQGGAGKFEVKLMNLAVFQADEKKKESEADEEKPFAENAPEEKSEEKSEEKPGEKFEEGGGEEPPKGAGGSNIEARIVAMETLMMQMAKMMGLPYGGVDMSDKEAERPDGAPAEQSEGNVAPPNSANMEQEKAQAKEEAKMAAADAGAAAKFAAYEGRIAALEAKDAARIEADRVAALTAGAIKDLTGYPMPEDVKAKIGKFAKAGKDILAAFVESYKSAVPKDTPKTAAEFEANPGDIAPNDPVIAQFQAKGPKAVEAAMAALAEWRQLSKMKGFTVSAEKHVAIRVREKGL